MPREATALVREGGHMNAEKYFVLSFEGTVTEKRYFEALRASDKFNDSGLIEMIPLVRKKNEPLGSDPISVKSLLKKAKEEFNFKPTDEFWVIVDRDDWAEEHHINLEKLVEDCKAVGNFHIAMSNPCFELWLILHRTDLSSFTEEEKNAIRLNERVSNSKHQVDVVLEKLIGHSYKKRLKGDDFIPYVYDAIRRAEEGHVEGDDLPKDLGSDVYLLVQKLVIPNANG
jgi:hypothetical protein